MSRLDWFTITVVLICLAAIGFLAFKTTGLSSESDPAEEVKTELEKDLNDMGLESEETIDPDNIDTEATNSSKDSNMSGEEAVSENDPIERVDEGYDDGDEEISSTTNNDGDYLVIAGSFSLMHNAENFASQLHKKGYSNAEVTKFKSKQYASVIVNRFDSKADAAALVKRLKSEGIESYVQRKRN